MAETILRPTADGPTRPNEPAEATQAADSGDAVQSGGSGDQDGLTSTAQNVGGVLASVLDGDDDDPDPYNGGDPRLSTAGADPAGLIVSILTTGSPESTQEGTHPGSSDEHIAAGTPSSVTVQAISIGSDTQDLGAPTAILTLGSTTVTAASGEPLVVDSFTLVVGGSAATPNGEPISMAPSGVVVNGFTVPFTTSVAGTELQTQPSGLVNTSSSPSQSIVLYTGIGTRRESGFTWILASGLALVAFL